MKTTLTLDSLDSCSSIPNSFGILNRTSKWIFGLVALLAFCFNVDSIQAQTQSYTSNGTFVVPLGVTSVQVEAWGGGGAGGGGNGSLFGPNRSGGGGAGGSYNKSTSFAVTPGQTINVTVGLGGVASNGGNGGGGGASTFGAFTAAGGGGGLVGDSNDGTGAGGAPGAAGMFAGGAGAAAPSSGTSGGGGGGAGNGGAGAAAAGQTGGGGGIGAIPGGVGATGRTNNGAGAAATALSAGGAGGRTSGNSDVAGGNGFRGQVIVTYTCPTYALTSTSASGPFCGPQTSLVSLTSALTNGTYSMTYNLSGATTAGPTTVSVAISGGNGTFTTPTLNAGTTTITITSITSSYCTSTLAANNTATVTVTAAPTANAGGALSMCSTAGSVSITGTATNFSSVLWTSSGDGTFTDADSLTLATYSPGPNDIASGSAVLTLTATGNTPCGNATSNRTLTVSSPPIAIAGGTQDICSNGTATVSGASSSNGTIAWTENGAGSITSGANTLTPTYTPGVGENATVTLLMTVTNSGCGSVSDTYTVNVTAAPLVNAGTAQSMCSDAGSVNVTTGATSSNNAGVLWTSSGTGTFADADSLTLAVYTPSEDDITAGSVILTLTATGNTPCGNATSNKTLTIKVPPTATAGGEQTICQNQTATVSGASASNGTILWTENGAGSITAGGTTLTPTYTAAAGDAGNTVILTMTVSNAPCSPATATYTVNVLALPTAIAGSAMSTCSSTGTINITAGSSVSNTDGFVWTSNGDGNFTNADSLTDAEYTPGSGDIAAGSVTLTLTASGNGSCNSASSNKVLTILPVPVTTGVVICAGQSGSLTSSTVCTSTAPISSGVELPASGTNAGGGTAWTNPGNIISNNNTNATVAGTGTAFSQVLAATNFGFAIPANASIKGIQASIARFRSGGFSGEIQDNSVRLIKAGALAGSNYGATSTNWPTSETVANYGTTTDLWGTTWTPAQVNATNFGVALVVDNTSGSFSRTANVDYMQITITYTVPGTLNWYTVSSGGTPIGSGLSFNPVGVAGSGLADTNTAGTTTFWAECATVTGCRTPATFVINPLPEVSFTGLGGPYCEDAAAVALQGNYNSGTFTGAGITSNGDGTASFNPATAGVGTHSITYSYTDGNTCVNTTSQNVTVNANVTYYADADGDGFGDIAFPQVSCMGAPFGYVANSTDCDDTDNTKNATFPFYVDADGDSFGAGSLVQVCAVDGATPPAGYSLSDTDCNDSDNTMNETFQFYADNDSDGFGAGSLVSVCAVDANTPPAGYTLNNTDCNDADATMNATFSFYADADGDTYGAGDLINDICAVNATTAPAGYSVNNTDCNDNVAAVNPGASEVLYDGVDNNCNNQLDEGFQLKTKLLPAVCGATLASIGSLVGITTVSSAITGYRIKATNGATVQIIETNVPHFTIPSLPSHDYATTYSIEIELQRNGVWLGYYGDACLVSTPAVLAEGGATQVSPSQCGITLARINTLIATTSLQGVTGYRFRVTNITPGASGPNVVQTIDRTQHWFSLPMLTQYNYGATYTIEVAVKTTGDYSGFGSPCDVSSPPAPTLVNCGGVVATPNTLVAATSTQGVTQYRFQITRMSDLASNTIDRNTNYFAFSMVPAYTPGALYSIRVAVMTVGTWSTFGDACEITSPGAATRFTPEAAPLVVETEFKAIAYPNPFASAFAIDVTSSVTETVNVNVYDMTGKLIEVRESNAADLSTLQLGDRYPSGVYNVIVTQGENVKTLRVIKR